MIRPLSLFIGWRYTRAKKRTNFVSFISFASVIGVALGVAVLITVLSVMNGFDYQIRNKFFAVAPQVTVVAPYDQMASWPQLLAQSKQVKDVTGGAPFSSGQGMIIAGQQIQGVQVLGILPKQEKTISKLNQFIKQGRYDSLTSGGYHALIGMALARRFNLAIGDKFNVFTPQTSVTLAGVFPQYRQFTVSGIFSSDSGFQLDSSVMYIHFNDCLRLFGRAQSVSGLHLTLSDLYQAGAVTQQLSTRLSPDMAISNWTQSFGAFFQALNMEKTVLFIILLLIVAVAAFNLVATLVMVVNDKQPDIAILRTLGARPGLVMRSFIWQGAIIGLLGTTLGVIGGVLLSWNITAFANWLQDTLHVQLISSAVYLLDYLPSRLLWSDVAHIGGLAFAMCLLATIYPAWMAFRTQPAEALRYE